MEYISVRIGTASVPVAWILDQTPVVQIASAPGAAEAIRGSLHDWSGCLVSPESGDRFLETAFDTLFLRGFDPQWTYVGRCGLDSPDLLEDERGDADALTCDG